jgi:hypothetical protein
MEISQFLERFGTNTTSNFDLIDIARILNIPNFYCLMSNEINKLRRKKLPLYAVINYQSEKFEGTHWVCLYKDTNQSYYFDSYGLQIIPELESYLRGGIQSTFKIQPDNTQMCGSLCMFVLHKLSKNEDFYNIVLELNTYFNINVSC